MFMTGIRSRDACCQQHRVIRWRQRIAGRY
jgi:hypothetical protein